MKYRYKRVFALFFCSLFLICLNVAAFGQTRFRRVNDFDGDGKADFAVTRNIGGYKYWYVWQSTAGFKVFQWGLNEDENVAGDYDGDNQTDYAVFRKEAISADTMRYTFWIYASQLGFRREMDVAGVYPNVVGHQQDYDGDNRTDFAYTTGNDVGFYVRYSNGSPGVFAYLTGVPVKIGDITGDGRAELAVFDPRDGYVNSRITPNATVGRRFGEPGDMFVPADFDGDGKGDLAIYRPSTRAWWWMRSSDNVVRTESFGAAGDVPVPADYDGDGKTDIAVWRSGQQSYYWVKGSQAGVFVVPWGVSGDSAVTY